MIVLVNEQFQHEYRSKICHFAYLLPAFVKLINQLQSKPLHVGKCRCGSVQVYDVTIIDSWVFRFKLKTMVWFSCCCKCQSVIPPWPCLRKAAAVYLPSSIARCAGLVSVDGFPVALINDVIGIEINGLINRQLPRQLRHMFTRLSVQKCPVPCICRLSHLCCTCPWRTLTPLQCCTISLPWETQRFFKKWQHVSSEMIRLQREQGHNLGHTSSRSCLNWKVWVKVDSKIGLKLDPS